MGAGRSGRGQSWCRRGGRAGERGRRPSGVREVGLRLGRDAYESSGWVHGVVLASCSRSSSRSTSEVVVRNPSLACPPPFLHLVSHPTSQRNRAAVQRQHIDRAPRTRASTATGKPGSRLGARREREPSPRRSPFFGRSSRRRATLDPRSTAHLGRLWTSRSIGAEHGLAAAPAVPGGRPRAGRARATKVLGGARGHARQRDAVDGRTGSGWAPVEESTNALTRAKWTDSVRTASDHDAARVPTRVAC